MPSTFQLDKGTAGSAERVGSITTQSQASVNNTAADIVSSNTNRRLILLVNEGSNDCWINFNTTATTANGIILKSGGGALLLDRIVPTTAVSAICASGLTTTVDIMEL